jgi:hypothetical protein
MIFLCRRRPARRSVAGRPPPRQAASQDTSFILRPLETFAEVLSFGGLNMILSMNLFWLLSLVSCFYQNRNHHIYVHGFSFSTLPEKNVARTSSLDRRYFFLKVGSVVAITSSPLVIASPAHDSAIASGGATAGKYT